MSSSALRAAVLIVSTTAAQDPSTDASEAVLRDVLEQEGGGKWELVDTKIVPDVVVQIQRQIMSWADAAGDHGINLILTTGGTGFATSDSTPEVTIWLPFSTSLCVFREIDIRVGRLGTSSQAGARAGPWNVGSFTKRYSL
jgi:molybdopterin biosynthesis enzyme MoaB